MHQDDFIRDREAGEMPAADDDEILKRVSMAPEFPPASRQQVEESWAGIVAHIQTARAGAAEQRHGWMQAILPQAPAWAFQAARVAALLVVGFVGAWYAAGQGWLPGTAPDPVASTSPPRGLGEPSAGASRPADGGDDATPHETPNRAWLAGGDYGGRLEALLLSLGRGESTEAQAEAPAVRRASRELLSDSRFYRRVAEHSGDPALADLLSRVEIVLLALATAPEGQEEEVLVGLRQFVAESDLLGQLREVRSSVPEMPRPRTSTVGS